MNIDYKIFTKTIASRLETIIPKIIQEDQSGFIKGRFIGQNIRLAQDIIDYTDKKNIPGIILQLDFEKAFDSIEWEYIWKVLKKFNFGEKICQIIKMFYNKIESTVLNNGFTCGWFRLSRGMRQGCPLSGFLFLITIEILAILIRENVHIKGLNINDIIYKISQFADDATCFLQDWQSVIELFKLAKMFKHISGLSLNENKTLLIWLGPWRTKTNNPLSLQQQGECFNMLGIYMGRNKDKLHKANFLDKIEKLKQVLNMWGARNLSLIGKILAVKSVGISNLIYSMTNMSCDIKTIVNVQQVLNKFVWRNKPSKVKHSSMIADYEGGGLKLIDVKSMNMALKMPWISRILSGDKWSTLINSQLQKYGGLKFMMQCNFEKGTFDTIPEFYKDILRFFSYIFVNKSARYIIWNNKEVLIDKKKYLLGKLEKQRHFIYPRSIRSGGKLAYVSTVKIKVQN